MWLWDFFECFWKVWLIIRIWKVMNKLVFCCILVVTIIMSWVIKMLDSRHHHCVVSQQRPASSFCHCVGWGSPPQWPVLDKLEEASLNQKGEVFFLRLLSAWANGQSVILELPGADCSSGNGQVAGAGKLSRKDQCMDSKTQSFRSQRALMFLFSVHEYY